MVTTFASRILLFGSLLIVGCSSPPEDKRAITPNPTKYIFSCGKDSLRQAIITAVFTYNAMELYINPGDWPSDAADIVSKPENQEDFYLSAELLPWIGESFEYPGLMYDAAFHLHIASIDGAHTELLINTIKPRVVTGKEFLPSFPHFARDYKYYDVEPSTVEEYEILFRIGQSLGENMPQVKYPQ